MNRLIAVASFCVLSIVSTAAFAHPARIYNDTDVELDIKVFHFDDLSKVWKTGIINDGERSDVVDLAHGNRILVAKDAITGDIVFTYAFKMVDKGIRLKLTGTSPDIKIAVAYTEDP